MAVKDVTAAEEVVAPPNQKPLLPLSKVQKDLLQDIIEEILARLPVKSLIRFRCLNKWCCALLQSHYFVMKHFLIQSTASSSKPVPLLAISHSLSSHQKRISATSCISLLCVSDYDDEIKRSSKEDEDSVTIFSDKICRCPIIELEGALLAKKRVRGIVALGPCNGIFCLWSKGCFRRNLQDNFVLWNPATREVKVLPAPHLPRLKSSLRLYHGFGIDPKTNHYKVVRIMVDLIPLRDPFAAAEVYNLSTNSWTMIDAPDLVHSLCFSQFNSYVNGAYHWLSEKETDISVEKFIVCFDLSTALFRKMKVPAVVPELKAPMFIEDEGADDEDIAVIDGCLAYIVSYLVGPSEMLAFEIWVMNDYGDEGTWTKRYNIGPHPFLACFWDICKGGQILAGNHNVPVLLLYNGDKQPMQRILFDNHKRIVQVLKFVESMVPLSVSPQPMEGA